MILTDQLLSQAAVGIHYNNAGTVDAQWDDLTVFQQAGALTNFGFPTFNAANAIDDNTGTIGWDTDGAVMGARIRITFPTPRDLCGVDLYLTDTCAAIYDIQYSDDTTNWFNAQANQLFPNTGWNVAEFLPAGKHLYWRLYLVNTPGVGGDVGELVVYESAGFAPTVTLTPPSNPAPYFAALQLQGYAPDVVAIGTGEFLGQPGVGKLTLRSYGPSWKVRRRIIRGEFPEEVAPRLPTPEGRYDGENETQFRRDLERWIAGITKRLGN